MDARRTIPEYDPACGVNRFVWILLAAQSLRATRDGREAESVARIEQRARTHGNGTQDDRQGD